MLNNDLCKAITQNVQTCLFVLNENSEIIFLNKKAEETFGYTVSDLLDKNFFTTLTSSNHNHILAADFMNAMKEGQPLPDLIEIDCIKRNRKIIKVEIVPGIIQFQGEHICIICARDITEQKELERKQKEYHEIFLEATNHARDAIILMDNNGKITYWNPAAEEVFGYKFIEVYNQDLHTLLAPKRYHEAYKKGFTKFKHSGTGYAIGRILELKAIHKDGYEFDMEISLSGLKLDNSWHALAVIRNITERKEADILITNKLAYYESIISALKGRIYAVTPDRDLHFLKDADKEQFKNDLEDQKCYEVLFERDSICPWCKLDEVIESDRQITFNLTNPVNNADNTIVNVPMELYGEKYMLGIMLPCADDDQDGFEGLEGLLK